MAETQARHVVVPDSARNNRVAAIALGVSFAMLGLAFASVPLYRLFCQVTGYGGTTRIAAAAPTAATNRDITIRFDANVSSGMGWTFHPKEGRMTIKVGEPNFAFYLARNTTDKTVTGSAIFNVTPPEAGAFFNKIACFCFTEQTLKPGETAEMPVQFFVDPAIANDPDTRSIREITLSYSFYPVNQPAGDASVAAKTN